MRTWCCGWNGCPSFDWSWNWNRWSPLEDSLGLWPRLRIFLRFRLWLLLLLLWFLLVRLNLDLFVSENRPFGGLERGYLLNAVCLDVRGNKLAERLSFLDRYASLFLVQIGLDDLVLHPLCRSRLRLLGVARARPVSGCSWRSFATTTSGAVSARLVSSSVTSAPGSVIATFTMMRTSSSSFGPLFLPCFVSRGLGGDLRLHYGLWRRFRACNFRRSCRFLLF